MKRFIILIVVSVFCKLVCGQTSFRDASIEILGDEKLFSTVCIAIDDINSDRKDDLILLDGSKFLKTFIQGGRAEEFEYQYHKQVSNFGSWAIITGDLNNDSQPEIIASGTENGSDILFLTNGIYETKQTTENIYSQNTNLVDLNNDSFLDLFVCNDTGESLTYLNNGDGRMIATKIIDFKTSEDDDMSGNYSSVFTDIDNDGDQDLYIGKCKAGVSDPTDRRRINTLYINNGDGTFSEQAQNFGLASGAQTWSVDAGDVDNDGDIDFIIANHDRQHELMLNDGNGKFTKFQALPDASQSYAYQSFFEDFDNNGWLDIFITEPANSYILYNDSMSFSMRDMKIGGRKAFTGASGDFNSDGFPDLYLGFASSFQMPGNIPDKVLLNRTNHYKWLDINLEGSESNKDGIGSRVTIYYEGGAQMREVKAGQSYGIMNSTTVHFGLHELERLDSIRVDWPSGSTSLLTDMEVLNQHIVINENGCQTSRYYLADYELCEDESIEVPLPDGVESVLWSNGSTENVLITSEEGFYSVQFVLDGCLVESNVFEIGRVEEEGSQLIEVQKTVICEDETIRLIANPSLQYKWNEGSTSQSIEVDQSGLYQVTVTTNCGEKVSELINIYSIDKVESEVQEDSALLGEVAQLFISGADVKWYQYKNDEDFIGADNYYITPPLTADTSFYAGNTNSGNLFATFLMEDVPLNSASDSVYTMNDTLDFTIYQDVLINSINIRTQTSGKRQLELYRNNSLVWNETIDFAEGVTNVPISITLATGDYYLTTNIDTNLMYIETESPQFSFSEFYNELDKKVAHFIKIGKGRVYENTTPYFFRWDLTFGFYTCESRYKVNAYLKDPVNTKEETKSVHIFPNPSNGSVIIESDLSMPYTISVLTMDGILIKSNLASNYSNSLMNLDLEPGNYILVIQSDNYTLHEKLVVF